MDISFYSPAKHTGVGQTTNCNADLRLYDVYIDNGETGTKVDRPGFNRLMEDIRSGKVDCVVVKDFSRFGRNYIEVGAQILLF